MHFLTRQAGLVSLIAKGSKRPKSRTGGAIDLLAEGDLVFTTSRSGALGTLMEFTETVTRSALRSDARRLNSALYMIELAGAMLAEDDPHPELFDLLHNALERLAHDDAPLRAVQAYYQWRLLRNVGLLGDLDSCVSCGLAIRPTETGETQASETCFCSRLGGLLCPSCETSEAEKYRLDGATLAGLGALADAEAGKKASLDETQAASVSRLLAYHSAHQLGRHLKMERYVVD